MTDDPTLTNATEPTTTPTEPVRRDMLTRFSSTNQPANKAHRHKDKIAQMFDLRHRLAEQGFDIAAEFVKVYKEAVTVSDKRKLLELAARHTLPTYSKVEADITTTPGTPVIMWRDEFDAAVEMAQAALEQAGHVIDAEFAETKQEGQP